jgi:hypothetical protein
MRRHGGTVVMTYGVKRGDFKKMGALLAVAGIFEPDMTRLKRCGFFTTLHRHEDDWVSPNGRTADGKTWLLGPIVPSAQASYEPRGYMKGGGPEEKFPGRKRSWGGGGAHMFIQLPHGPKGWRSRLRRYVLFWEIAAGHNGPGRATNRR